jgi:hypothetical protein
MQPGGRNACRADGTATQTRPFVLQAPFPKGRSVGRRTGEVSLTAARFRDCSRGVSVRGGNLEVCGLSIDSRHHAYIGSGPHLLSKLRRRFRLAVSTSGR